MDQDQPNTPETPHENRRTGEDRRKVVNGPSNYNGPDRRAAHPAMDDETGLARLRGPGRRRADDRRSAEEGEMTSEQFEFIKAIETYKKVNKKMYPTWTEIMEIFQQLGYRKVLAREVNLINVPEPALYTGEPADLPEETDAKKAA